MTAKFEYRTYHKPTCINGAQWMKDCNVCTCLDGTSFCTNLRCTPAIRNTEVDENMKCTPGSKWMKECNWCRCANGNQICSLSVCTNDNHTEKCSEGSQWRKDDCTWCTCNNGSPVCNQVKCIITPHVIDENIPSVVNYPAPSSPAPCKDGSMTSDGCNWCRCTNNVQICTQMECVDFNQPPKTTESSVSQQDPNPQHDPAIVDDQCKDGNTWTDGCSGCICVQGIEVCSGQVCLREANV